MEPYPFEFCFWIRRKDLFNGTTSLFNSPLHDDGRCRYGGYNKFSYFGPVAIVSPGLRQCVVVPLVTAHTSRWSYVLQSNDFPHVEAPFLLTDAIDTVFKGYYHLTFTPHDPEIHWASTHEEEDGGGPIVHEVISPGFFGRIHFTGVDTALLMVFTAGWMTGPTVNDRILFADDENGEPIGMISNVVPIELEKAALIFARG